MEKEVGKEFMNIVMEISMKVNGNKIKNMEKEY